VDLSPRAVRSARDMEGLRLLYAAEIAYDDGLVGRILSGLERAGRLDTTAIVVTSDHGENLGDHAPLDHQLGLWDSLVRIPLIVRAPAVPAGQIQSGLASLTDVPAALGRDSGFEPIGGEQRHDAVFFEYDRSPHLLGLIRDRLKLTRGPGTGTSPGCARATKNGSSRRTAGTKPTISPPIPASGTIWPPRGPEGRRRRRRLSTLWRRGFSA